MHYASFIWVDSIRQMLKHGGVGEGGGISKDLINKTAKHKLTR